LPQEPQEVATLEYNVVMMIIYWSDEDGAFLVDVPELPGCMADGATYEEAVAHAKLIIAEWIETAQELGRSVPEPRGRLMFA
jgi:predicted RNase H-like HicB family nuclease